MSIIGVLITVPLNSKLRFYEVITIFSSKLCISNFQLGNLEGKKGICKEVAISTVYLVWIPYLITIDMRKM